ncbi:hypothetical protein NDU88_003226 [Pleurodeles waltl]|uniref:Uncharacterized protein n=1 Tax=Pleurodeles waltl TaxID=8319 RepID=A0AAV7W500_PLEWA|nr:hypothetical protein NDU88_003226 [Pleurodeles waltl]
MLLIFSNVDSDDVAPVVLTAVIPVVCEVGSVVNAVGPALVTSVDAIVGAGIVITVVPIVGAVTTVFTAIVTAVNINVLEAMDTAVLPNVMSNVAPADVCGVAADGIAVPTVKVAVVVVVALAFVTALVTAVVISVLLTSWKLLMILSKEVTVVFTALAAEVFLYVVIAILLLS